MLMSQGRLAEWDKERLSQSDLPVSRFRRKMKKAFAAEKRNTSQAENENGITDHMVG